MTAPDDIIERQVALAFSETNQEIEEWNALNPSEHPLEFTHHRWMCNTLFDLVNEDFTIDGRTMITVARLTGCVRINAT
jgi:hypothetical protein